MQQNDGERKKKKKVEKKVNKIRFYFDFAKNHTAEINERKNSTKKGKKNVDSLYSGKM